MSVQCKVKVSSNLEGRKSKLLSVLEMASKKTRFRNPKHTVHRPMLLPNSKLEQSSSLKVWEPAACIAHVHSPACNSTAPVRASFIARRLGIILPGEIGTAGALSGYPRFPNWRAAARAPDRGDIICVRWGVCRWWEHVIISAFRIAQHVTKR